MDNIPNELSDGLTFDAITVMSKTRFEEILNGSDDWFDTLPLSTMGVSVGELRQGGSFSGDIAYE